MNSEQNRELNIAVTSHKGQYNYATVVNPRPGIYNIAYGLKIKKLESIMGNNLTIISLVD